MAGGEGDFLLSGQYQCPRYLYQKSYQTSYTYLCGPGGMQGGGDQYEPGGRSIVRCGGVYQKADDDGDGAVRPKCKGKQWSSYKDTRVIKGG